MALPWYWISWSKPVTSISWLASGPSAKRTCSGRIENGCGLPLSCLARSPRITLEVPTNSATKVVAGFMYRLRGLSTCSMRPLLNTATRSDIDSASVWSWVTKMKVMPSWRCSFFSSLCICSRSFKSSAPSGSSSKSTRGRLTRARARATRWR
ncbi:hypothetical protein D3C73_1231510 [compost metagenome]